MTIITAKGTEQKSDIPPPEISDSSLLIENEKNEKKIPNIPSSVVVNVRQRRVPTHVPIILQQRRHRSIWLALLGLLLLLVLLLGSICLYRNLLDNAHHEKQTFFCGVRFHETYGDDITDFNLMKSAKRTDKFVNMREKLARDRFEDQIKETNMFAKEFIKDLIEASKRMGEFEQEVEMDDSFDYEKILVPTIGDTRKATILHDFNINYTAIIDKEQGFCFLLPLNRSLVLPPKDFWDLLLKLKNGYYVPDTNVVRERYRVVTPAIRDFSDYGVYIAEECRVFDTYKLAKEGEPIAMAKRSVCELAGNNYCLGDAGSDRMMCFSIRGCV